MSAEKAKAALKITIPILIAVFSIFIASRLLSSSDYVKYCTESINQNRDTVLKLSASSTAASAAITALPGDFATPIAEELAQMSKGFLVVLCALYLEKFMVAISGAVVFKWLIPVSCGLYIMDVLFKKGVFRSLSMKLCVLSMALLLVVPISVKISDMVEGCYHELITQVIESAENSADQIQESVDGSQNPEEAGNGLGKIIQSLKNSGDTIANGTSQMIDYFERLLSRFAESLAIMLVISCGIPLLVIMCFHWIMKALFQFDPHANYQYIEKQILAKPAGEKKIREKQIDEKGCGHENKRLED